MDAPTATERTVMRISIIGAGFSGCVLATELARAAPAGRGHPAGRHARKLRPRRGLRRGAARAPAQRPRARPGRHRRSSRRVRRLAEPDRARARQLPAAPGLRRVPAFTPAGRRAGVAGGARAGRAGGDRDPARCRRVPHPSRRRRRLPQRRGGAHRRRVAAAAAGGRRAPPGGAPELPGLAVAERLDGMRCDRPRRRPARAC